MPDFLYVLPLPLLYGTLIVCTGVISLLLFALPYIAGVRSFVRSASSVAPLIQTLMGTFFVLSVTFLSSSVWQSEDKAEEAIAAEARSLRIIRTYAENMVTPTRDAFVKMIADYARAVRDIEWSDIEEQGFSVQAEDALRQMYRGAIAGLGDGEAGKTIKQAVLGALDDISQARETRLTLANNVISPIQGTVVLVFGALLLLAIAVCHEREKGARAFALSLVTIAISTALFALLAHDRPFIGPLALTPKPIISAAGL